MNRALANHADRIPTAGRPCPECGGHDRFYYIAEPYTGGDPYWRCRQCDYTEPDSDSTSGPEPADGTRNARSTTPEHQRAAHHAYAVVAELAAKALWQPSGRGALAYLHRRGLADETIRDLRFGYVADGAELFRDLWYAEAVRLGVLGLRADVSAYTGAKLAGLRGTQGKPNPVLFGPCITIPYYHGDTCITVRSRSLRSTGPKYGSPTGTPFAGATPRLYLADSMADRPVVVLTEGEFKAAAGFQAWRTGYPPMPGPVVAVPGVPPVDRKKGESRVNPAYLDQLRGRRVLVCFDTERSGIGEHAARRLAVKLFRAGIDGELIRLPLAAGADKTDLDSYLLAVEQESL